jgi:hypothetical protein
VQIAFLVCQMNMDSTMCDVQNFILRVFVRWDFISWIHLLGQHHQVLRVIVLRADFQDEFPSRRLSPDPSPTLTFLQQERL